MKYDANASGTHISKKHQLKLSLKEFTDKKCLSHEYLAFFRNFFGFFKISLTSLYRSHFLLNIYEDNSYLTSANN
uniref:Uncharacterized protein n=1 Tax=Parascaris univalens TaxID=6257 RepID=A0A914ZLF7_PARUN